MTSKSQLKNIFYGSLGYILSYIIKQDKSMVCLGCREGHGFYDNTRYYYEHLKLKYPNKEIIWVTRDKNYEIKHFPNNTVYYYSLKGQLLLARSKYLITTHSYRDVMNYIPINKKFVSLWHGIPLKRMDIDSKIWKNKIKQKLSDLIVRKTVPDLFLVNSDKDIRNFHKAYKIPYENFCISNYPRNQYLYDNAKRSSECNIILYAPTFRDGYSKEDYARILPRNNHLEIIDRYCRQTGNIFILKLHPYMVCDEYSDTINNYDAIHIENEKDITELLTLTKLLITDYSSVYFDFLIVDRPIYFYCPDLKWYINDKNRGIYYDYYDVTPGEKFFLLDDLVNYIISEPNDEFSLERKRVFSEYIEASFDDNIKLDKAIFQTPCD